MQQAEEVGDSNITGEGLDTQIPSQLTLISPRGTVPDPVVCGNYSWSCDCGLLFIPTGTVIYRLGYDKIY